MWLFLATLAVAAAVAAGEVQFEDDGALVEGEPGSLGLIEDVGVTMPGVVVLPSGHHMDLAVHRALRRLHSRGLAMVPEQLEQAWDKTLPEDFEDDDDEQGEGEPNDSQFVAAVGKSAARSPGSTPAGWWEFATSSVRRVLQRRGAEGGLQQGRAASQGGSPEADATVDAEIVANAACDVARGAGEGHVVAMAALGEMALFLSLGEWPQAARDRAGAVLTASSQAYIRRGPGHGHSMFGCDLDAAEALETLQQPPLGAWDDPILPTRILRIIHAHLAGSPGGNAAFDALRARGVAADSPGVDPTADVGPPPPPLSLDTTADAVLLLDAAFRIGRAGFVYTKVATRAAQAAAEAAGLPRKPQFGIAAFAGQLDSSVAIEVMPGVNLPVPVAQSILAYVHAGGLLAVLDEARLGAIPLLRGRKQRQDLATSLSNQGSPLAALLSGRRLANSLAGIGPEPVPKGPSAKREAVCSAALAIYMRLADATVRSEDVNAAQQSSGQALWELHENANAAAETAERARSRQYYEELEAQGDVGAADALGQMYFNGDHAAGVTTDMGAALRHFQRAAQLGSGAGHANMAMMHLNALGWDKEAGEEGDEDGLEGEGGGHGGEHHRGAHGDDQGEDDWHGHERGHGQQGNDADADDAHGGDGGDRGDGEEEEDHEVGAAARDVAGARWRDGAAEVGGGAGWGGVGEGVGDGQAEVDAAGEAAAAGDADVGAGGFGGFGGFGGDGDGGGRDGAGGGGGGGGGGGLGGWGGAGGFLLGLHAAMRRLWAGMAALAGRGEDVPPAGWARGRLEEAAAGFGAVGHEAEDAAETRKLAGQGPSDAAALWHYQRAAELGVPAAWSGLGFLYMHGRGVPMNRTMALEYMERASEEGDVQASTNLAVLLLDGSGGAAGEDGIAVSDTVPLGPDGQPDWNYIRPNTSRARHHLNLAANAGVPEAMFNLGMMEMYGWDGEANCSKALPWMRAVAERGVWRKRTLVSREAADVAWTPPPEGGSARDEDLAVRHLAALSALGIPDAQADLGFALERGVGAATLGPAWPEDTNQHQQHRQQTEGDAADSLAPVGSSAEWGGSSADVPWKPLLGWTATFEQGAEELAAILSVRDARSLFGEAHQPAGERGISGAGDGATGAEPNDDNDDSDSGNAAVTPEEVDGVVAEEGQAQGQTAVSGQLPLTGAAWRRWAAWHATREIYPEAADAGIGYAMRRLGMCWSPGGSCGVNLTLAAEWLWRGVRAMDGHSHHALALLEARQGGVLAPPGERAWAAVWDLLEDCLDSDYLAGLPVTVARTEVLWRLGAEAAANQGRADYEGNVTVLAVLRDAWNLVTQPSPAARSHAEADTATSDYDVGEEAEDEADDETHASADVAGGGTTAQAASQPGAGSGPSEGQNAAEGTGSTASDAVSGAAGAGGAAEQQSETSFAMHVDDEMAARSEIEVEIEVDNGERPLGPLWLGRSDARSLAMVLRSTLAATGFVTLALVMGTCTAMAEHRQAARQAPRGH